MGKNESSIKITVDGVSFVAFSDTDLAAALKDRPLAHAQIVGRPQLNEWMGNTTVQVMIDDIEITDVLSAAPKKVNILSLI
jgi:hypothetical protein